MENRYLKIAHVRVIPHVLMQLSQVCLWQDFYTNTWVFLHHIAMPFRFTQGSFFSPCFTLIKWVYRFCNFTFKKAITYFSSLLAVSRNFGSKLLCMHSCLTCTSGTQIPFQFRGRNNLLKLQSILDSAILFAFNFFKKSYWTNYN